MLQVFGVSPLITSKNMIGFLMLGFEVWIKWLYSLICIFFKLWVQIFVFISSWPFSWKISLYYQHWVSSRIKLAASDGILRDNMSDLIVNGRWYISNLAYFPFIKWCHGSTEVSSSMPLSINSGQFQNIPYKQHN